MKNKKRRIISFSLAFVLATVITSDTYKEQKDRIFFIEEIDNPHYIGSCYDGNAYLGTEVEIKKLIESGMEGIFIIDERNEKEQI